MGYHVTILRTRRGAPVPIERAEVEAVVAARPELEAKAAGDGTLEIAIRALGDESPLLVWQDGEVWTKNPDDATVQLLLDLAKPLGARVRGDEGETYRTATDSYEHPDDAEANAASRVASERQWRRKRWLGYAPLAVFFLLGLLVAWCGRR